MHVCICIYISMHVYIYIYIDAYSEAAQRNTYTTCRVLPPLRPLGPLGARGSPETKVKHGELVKLKTWHFRVTMTGLITGEHVI